VYFSRVTESRSGVPKGVQNLALLRGINVGGKGLIKMADLRAAVEQMGFDDVATYIASGNVLFRASRQNREALAERIESELTRRFGMELRVVLLTEAQLKGVIEGAPRGFGADGYLCDVIFIRKPLTAKRAFGLVDPREGVDEAWQGKGVLYFSRLAAKASNSRLNRIASTPEYKNMTIRSWSTTQKLLALLDSRNAG
jgi:uncharacterized protein (DUF1697 family)